MKHIAISTHQRNGASARSHDGRFPHSDACEALARSGRFAREVAHLLLALARQPSN